LTAAEYKYVMSYPVAEPAVRLAEREVPREKRATAANNPEQHHYVLAVKIMGLALVFCLGTVFCYSQDAVLS